MPRGQPSKYEPLRAHLAGLPPDVAEVTLTYRELAAVLGSPPPAAAWTRAFWSNSSSPTHIQPQARAWQDAGWRVRRAAPGVWVTFARGAPTVGSFGRPVDSPP